MSETNEINETARIIEGLGGCAAVARKCGFKPKGGTQRVRNWIARNQIPFEVRVVHADVFEGAFASASADVPGEQS